MFDRSSSTALDDKIIVLARQGPDLLAFVSAVILPIPGLDDPVVHGGLVVTHPSHRKSGVVQGLFSALFLQILALHPKGAWMSTLTRVISSLAQMTKYTVEAFPSPQWQKDHGASGAVGPSAVHLHIARDISANHRGKMFVLPSATLDEDVLVFRGSKSVLHGPSYMKDADDPRYWHRDMELTEFYRALLRDERDEVLQIAFLDPRHIWEVANSTRYRDEWKDKYSKVCSAMFLQLE